MENTNIFFIPYAGGSSYSYLEFNKHKIRGINYIYLELPGRGRKFNEKIINDINLIVEEIYKNLKLQLEKPYALFGHSMGSLLCYLLTKKIISENKKKPLHLFLSGRAGPSINHKENIKNALPKEIFFDEIKKLGGMSETVLNDKDTLDLFEPILRADFHAVETYKYEITVPYNIPTDIFIGKNDEINLTDALEWQKETDNKINVHQLNGEHFFIFENIPYIVKVFESCL